jgi:hypothetical protein
VDELGIKSLSNGELLAYARERFDALITLDKGIQNQHNHQDQKLIIVILRVPDSRKTTILQRSAALSSILPTLVPGQILEIWAQGSDLA